MLTPTSTAPPIDERPRPRLAEIALVFLRLGATTFGGPAAHLAAMEDECVRRRRWLSADELLDLVGVTALLPGPNSTELAMAIGMRRHGAAGLVIAGGMFILPAALSVWALAALYSAAVGGTPGATWTRTIPALLSGIHPVVLAVVAQAAWRLGATLFRRASTRTAVVSSAIAVVVLVASLADVNEIWLLLASGVLGALAVAARSAATRSALLGAVLPAASVPSASIPLPFLGTGATLELPGLFLSFLRIGALLFGSGYALFAFLQQEFVLRLGVLTDAQVLDAIAVGQVTPGPLFTSATFVGYLLHGSVGALVATVGIFAPAFLLVALHGPIVRAVRRSPPLRGALDAVNAASLALMIGAVARGAAAGNAAWTVVVGVLAMLLLAAAKVPVWGVLLLGAGAGVLRGFLIG